MAGRVTTSEYEAVRAIGAHFGWKGEAYGIALTGFHESDRSDKPGLLDLGSPDEATRNIVGAEHLAGSVARYFAGVNRASDHISRLASFVADVSWERPSLGDEAARYREAAAALDRYARGLLWKISDCTFIPGPDVMGFADDYDGLRAVLRVVRAGWATAAPDGLIVTDHGRDVARRMFVDR